MLELDAPGPPELHYDEEWLAVMRSTHHLVNLRFAHAPLPGAWAGARCAREASDTETVTVGANAGPFPVPATGNGLLRLATVSRLSCQLCPPCAAVLRPCAPVDHTFRRCARPRLVPGMGRLRAGPKPEDVDFVRRALAERGGSQVPSNFTPTAPAYDPAAGQRRGRMPQHHVRNPQVRRWRCRRSDRAEGVLDPQAGALAGFSILGEGPHRRQQESGKYYGQ